MGKWLEIENDLRSACRCPFIQRNTRRGPATVQIVVGKEPVALPTARRS